VDTPKLLLDHSLPLEGQEVVRINRSLSGLEPELSSKELVLTDETLVIAKL